MDRAQALATDRFHYGKCEERVGPKGGRYVKREQWSRNGKNQLWKTRPNEFRIPIKYGMRSYDEINAGNVDRFHAEDECPLGS